MAVLALGVQVNVIQQARSHHRKALILVLATGVALRHASLEVVAVHVDVAGVTIGCDTIQVALGQRRLVRHALELDCGLVRPDVDVARVVLLGVDDPADVL
eukprot:15050594-Heterocapsa_arctica.AAC.1